MRSHLEDRVAAPPRSGNAFPATYDELRRLASRPLRPDNDWTRVARSQLERLGPSIDESR